MEAQEKIGSIAVDGRNDVRLVDVDFESARRLKWERGCIEHGSVMTENPLEALFSEFLDSVNYCGSIKQMSGIQENPTAIATINMMATLLTQLGKTIQEVVRELERQGYHYEPQTFRFK